MWKYLVANATVAAGDYSSYYDGYLLFLIQYTNGINIDDMARNTVSFTPLGVPLR